jgi:ribosomal protein S18
MYEDRNNNAGRFGGDDRDRGPRNGSRSYGSQGKEDNSYDMDGGEGRDGGGLYDLDKDRRMFSRKKTCWFCAKKEEPDWKDTSSYDWLINEFGKVSPGRITGLCAFHQRSSTVAVKRGRNMGFISYVSNSTAR